MSDPYENHPYHVHPPKQLYGFIVTCESLQCRVFIIAETPARALHFAQLKTRKAHPCTDQGESWSVERILLHLGDLEERLNDEQLKRLELISEKVQGG